MMRKVLSVVLPLAIVALLVGVAYAQMGWGPMYPGQMGPGMGWWQPGPGTQVTEENAKQLAQQYADKYLKGFTVDKVLPFTGMHGTMYSVELKGPQDELRILHVNPWGGVMPFGGPWRRAG
ncbi:MAG TPA: hypothetical protein VJO34_06255 [Methylomirabilota bacterium]|nr:hypothetical protein [Methylomirabilota bacterium]